MLGANCSPCCGCSVVSTANWIASKSCSLTVSGYIPKFEAATFIRGRSGAAIAFPSTWYIPSNPSDRQLAGLLMGDFFAEPGITVRSLMDCTLPSSVALALFSVGRPSFRSDGAEVLFRADSPLHSFNVYVFVTDTPSPGSAQVQGSKCHLSAFVYSVLRQPASDRFYASEDLNNNLIPSELAAQINPDVPLSIVVDDQPPAQAVEGGGAIRNGVVRVVAPFYNVQSRQAVFDSDIRIDQNPKQQDIPVPPFSSPSRFAFAGAASGAPDATPPETSLFAPLFGPSELGSLAISGSLSGNVTLSAGQMPAKGLVWGTHDPQQPDFVWGINPTFQNNELYLGTTVVRYPPSVRYSVSPRSYEPTKSTEKTSMQVVLS